MEGTNVNRSKIIKDFTLKSTKTPPFTPNRGLKVKSKDGGSGKSVKKALRRPQPPLSAGKRNETRQSSASSRSRMSDSTKADETESVLTEIDLSNINDTENSRQQKQPGSAGSKGRSKVKFVSPRQVLMPVNDSSYHITDSGLEELSTAFLTDFPEYSTTDGKSFYTADFYDRFDYLNNYLSELQDDCKSESQPKSILKPDRPMSAEVGETEEGGMPMKGRPHSAVIEREVVQKQRTPNEPLGNYRPHSVNVPGERNNRDSRYLLINQGNTYQLDLERCTCGLHGHYHNESASNKDTDIKLEPYVYGYQSGKQICAFKDEGPKGNLLNVGQSSDLVLRVPAVEDGESLTEERQDQGDPDPYGIPSTLKDFVPWLTADVPENVIGVNSMDCLVFLPGLNCAEDLPVVPPPQRPEEELNFKYKVKPSRARAKKHSHPWTKKPLEEWTCSHGSQELTTPRIKVIANSGQVMHETYSGERTPQILRKEIQELEDLMKGIGSFDGCVVVQMQAEINRINETLEEMKPRIQEILERERLRKEAAEPTDHFGMKAFYRHHEETLTQIRHQHRLCVLELIHLEDTADIDSGRRLFSRGRAEGRAGETRPQ